MKSLVILCVVALVGMTLAETPLYPNGCIYINGRCSEACEEGTHDYTVGCDIVTPDATCADPNPKPDVNGGSVCDYSACYCNSPTVRHPETNKCVPLEECPKNKE